MPAIDPHLRLPFTSFVGREAERGALVEILRRTPLLTLCGPPGIGKSRLGLEVAMLAGADHSLFRDGARWVDLAGVADPAGVLPAVASALGVHEQAGHTLFDVVVVSLRRRMLVLGIDNCEHLAEATSAIVHACRTRCPV